MKSHANVDISCCRYGRRSRSLFVNIGDVGGVYPDTVSVVGRAQQTAQFVLCRITPHSCYYTPIVENGAVKYLIVHEE